jgi:asparagine synthase (glutamine-hydrolysing)
VVNGEIYNYRELRHRLEGAGHRFRSHTDSEVIVHLYEDEGLDCFQHLSGMFAMAIWDRRERRLILARDRLGKKPLVYHQTAERLVFASELKSLLTLSDVPREVDPQALDHYLAYQYVPHPLTIYRGIYKLPPAHFGVYHEGQWKLESYWQPEVNFSTQSISVADAQRELRTRLTAAVRQRLQSDVPLGAFLSGGVDSSVLAALAQREMTSPLKTFTIGFAESEYDERPFAQLVAKHIGSEHTEEVVTPNAIALLPQLVQAFDEPFADSSAIPTWYLAQVTRRQVTVALSGDGGDELFLGYDRYRAVHWASYIDKLPWLRRILAAQFWQHLPSSSRQGSKLRQWKRFSAGLRQSPVERYFDWISIFNEQRRGELYSDTFLAQLSDAEPIQFLRSAWQRAQSRDAMTAAAIADGFTYLPCDLLTKVDICSMAHSLEARQPFLDHELVEFIARLPRTFKYRWGRGKRLLREAFGDLLPAAIWNRRKMGFGVPLAQWLRGQLRPQLEVLRENSCALANSGWFSSRTISQLIAEHQSSTFDHSARLWSLLILEEWLQRGKSFSPPRIANDRQNPA